MLRFNLNVCDSHKFLKRNLNLNFYQKLKRIPLQIDPRQKSAHWYVEKAYTTWRPVYPVLVLSKKVLENITSYSNWVLEINKYSSKLRHGSLMIQSKSDGGGLSLSTLAVKIWDFARYIHVWFLLIRWFSVMHMLSRDSTRPENNKKSLNKNGITFCCELYPSLVQLFPGPTALWSYLGSFLSD